jgi:hypothetical protein
LREEAVSEEGGRALNCYPECHDLVSCADLTCWCRKQIHSLYELGSLAFAPAVGAGEVSRPPRNREDERT